MCADAANFFRQGARCFAHGTAGKHDRSGGESAKPIWPHGSVAVSNRDSARIDSKLLRGYLRKRSLVSLAVIVYANIDQNAAVRQHADVRRLVARYHAELALHEFRGAVPALLGIKRKPHAYPASVRLTGCLSFADSRKINFFERYIERSDIISGIKLQAGCRPVGKLRGGDDILTPQLERLAFERAGNLVHKAFERKGCSRPRDSSVRAHRSFVGGNGMGSEPEMPHAIGPGQVAGRHACFLKGSGWP